METAEYRSSLAQLSSLAAADLASVLAAVDTGDGVRVRNALVEALPSLVQPYVTASALIAATHYEDLRRAAVSGMFYATADADVNREQLAAMARWGVRPMFGQGESTVHMLVSGGLQRIVEGAARSTIDSNARRDARQGTVAATSWSRQTNPGRAESGESCDFCVMLEGRGAVYRSAAAAGAVVGRGVDPSSAFNPDGSRRVGGIGGGTSARGVQQLASSYHDHCHCSTEPTFYRRELNYVAPNGQRFPSVLVPIK